MNATPNVFDWIVIGAGITGSALAYELTRQGCSVLLIEKDAPLLEATRYSYGGLAHWAGRTPLSKELGSLGLNRYRQLSQELDQSVEFRELDLLMPIPAHEDPQSVHTNYQDVRVPPQLLTPQEAQALEPLLDPRQISGALLASHAHVRPELTAAAFADAFVRKGGKLLIARVFRINQGSVQAGARTHIAGRIAICAGAWSRSLLQKVGLSLPLYFTHAELLEVPPDAGIRLQAMISPALLQRPALEKAATQPPMDPLWDQPNQELAPPILDVGAIQFRDGSLRIGQLSRTLSHLRAPEDPALSEAQIRRGIGTWIPSLENVPGTWRHCRVAFSPDQLPLIGSLPGYNGIHLFSSFSNPLVVVPVLAERFARFVTASHPQDDILSQLSPGRFGPPLATLTPPKSPQLRVPPGS